LDDFFNTSSGWPTRRSLMNDTFKLDVEENEQNYVITAELPGVGKDEIDLDLSEGRLTISVKREENVNEEKRNFIHRERRIASMARSVYLADADPEGVSAKLDNGMLILTAAKQDKTVRAKKIEIA
jgi:HSP20 family protein